MKSHKWNKTGCDIWVSAAHIPGSYNLEADTQSRILQDATERKLYSKCFYKITAELIHVLINIYRGTKNKRL